MSDLACPFYKQEPGLPHVHPRYEVCGSSSWSNMENLIGHLEETHYLYVCQRCFHRSRSKDERRTHEKNCIVPLPLTQAEAWRALWRKVYPSLPPPSSHKEESRQDTSSAAPPPAPASRHSARFHPYSRAPAPGRTSRASNPPPASAQNSVHQTSSRAHPVIQTNANQFGVESAQGSASRTIVPLNYDIPPSSQTDAGSNAPVQYPVSVHQNQLPPIRASSSFDFRNLPSVDDLTRNIQDSRHTDTNISNTDSESNNGQAADSQFPRYHIAGRRKSPEPKNTTPSSSSGPSAGGF